MINLTFLFASSSSTVVEQLNKDPKFEGLNLAVADNWRKKKKLDVPVDQLW